MNYTITLTGEDISTILTLLANYAFDYNVRSIDDADMREYYERKVERYKEIFTRLNRQIISANKGVNLWQEDESQTHKKRRICAHSLRRMLWAVCMIFRALRR